MRIALGACLVTLVLASHTPAGPATSPDSPRLNPTLLKLQPNVWVKFPNCAAYDSDRKAVLGYRGDGIWELAGEPRAWKRATTKAFLGGYHNNAAYDRKNRAMVVFGTNANSSDIEAYWPATAEHKLMPTPGARPPKDQHNPMAFEPALGQTVVVVDRNLTPEEKDKPKLQAETWLYDLAKDAWMRIESATLPFGVGMNYNMAYDPLHRCLLLVTGGYAGPTTVWALRVELPR